MLDAGSCEGCTGVCKESVCVAREVQVVLSPMTAKIHAGDSAALHATVTTNDPSASLDVTWSLADSGSSSGSLGALTGTSATYLAPVMALPEPVEVIATTVATPTASAAANVTVGSPLTVSASGFKQYMGTTSLVTANVAGLFDEDTGAVSFTVTSGSADLGAVDCKRSGTSAVCTVSFTPKAPGLIGVRAQSSDMESAAVELTVEVKDKPYVSVDRSDVHLFAFGQPAQSVTVNAEVKNLFSQTADMHFDVLSGTSAVIQNPTATSFSVYAKPPASGKFYFDAPPEPTVIRAQSYGTGAYTDITVHVHGWVDRSDELQADTPRTATALSMNAKGEVVLGGVSGSGQPVAVFIPRGKSPQVIANGWAPSAGTSPSGAFVSASLLDNGGVLLAGFSGAQDASYNYPLLALYCPRAPGALPSCPAVGNNLGAKIGNVAMGYSGAFSSSGFFVNPRIVGLDDTYKYITYSKRGTGCNAGMAARALYSFDLTSAFETGNNFTYSSDDPSSSAGNSCPFNEAANSAITGLTVWENSLWLGGVADCGTPFCTHEPDINPYGFHGLVAQPLGSERWNNYQRAAVSQDVSFGTLEVGYDGSLLALSTFFTANAYAGQVNGLYFRPGSANQTPTGFHYQAPAGKKAVGRAVAGAGTGGSSWAGDATDIFYSLRTQSDSVGTDYDEYFAWQHGTNAPVVVQTRNDSGVGELVIEIEIERVGDAVEGWLVGNRVGDGGVNLGPLVAELR